MYKAGDVVDLRCGASVMLDKVTDEGLYQSGERWELDGRQDHEQESPFDIVGLTTTPETIDRWIIWGYDKNLSVFVFDICDQSPDDIGGLRSLYAVTKITVTKGEGVPAPGGGGTSLDPFGPGFMAVSPQE